MPDDENSTDAVPPVRRSVRDRVTGRDPGLVTPPTPRGVQTLAALGLVITVIVGVGALAFDVVVYGESSAALVSIVSLGVGGVIALAGAAAGSSKKDE